MGSTNTINNVAIVGAGGNLGTSITRVLLKAGQHVVTALTRTDSTSVIPDGVAIKKIDYDDSDSLIDALRGQDALVITLSGRSKIQEIEGKLVRAAGEAGVPWILPNEWSPDSTNETILKDIPMFAMKAKTRKLIEDIGRSSYLAVVTGFWYEYSLATPANYGFDFANQSVTLFDEGETSISTSTWPQIGRAVAALLSLPIKADSAACLSKLRNQMVYISSFTVSQREMLASALRVIGAKEADWTVTKVNAQDRFNQGVEAVKKGDYSGFSKYNTRLFFEDGVGDFEHKQGTMNDVLRLPKEDLDEATKVAIERQKSEKKWE